MNHVNIYLFTHWNALSEFEFFHTKLLVDMFSPTILSDILIEEKCISDV